MPPPIPPGRTAWPALAVEPPAAQVRELEAEVRRLRAENARLKELLAEHGIEPGQGYQSIVEILDEMPAELKNPKSWDKFTIDAVHKWLADHPVGEPFEATLGVALVQGGKNPTAASSQTIGWMVSISPIKKDYKFRGVAFTQSVGGNWPLPLRLYGDAEFARSHEQLRAGQRFTVKGRSIHLGREDRGRRDVHVGPSDISVEILGR
ncbi:MAG: hypothetical protein J5I93_17305 [Pirellulaceae bacterium]|nr:hypothetical protein [Pirellulaceae bacterium]